MTVDPQLMEQARSADPDARQRAALAVARAGEKRDLPLMFELLGDRDWRVRKTIAEALARDGSEEVVDGLLGALSDPANAGKRNSATEALIRIGFGAMDQVLNRIRQERETDTRLALINLLGEIRSEESFTTLLELMQRESEVNLLTGVVTALGNYREAAALPSLLRLLEQHSDPWLRFHTIEALGKIGDRAAIPAILPFYADPSLRKPVLDALARIADIGTLGFLLRVLGEEERLNLSALQAIIRIAEAPKARIVREAERPQVQRKVRESFPPQRTEELLAQLSATSKRELKSSILKFLAWTRQERAVEVLLEALEDPDVAEAAAQGLIDYGPAATPQIVALLSSVEEEETATQLLRVVKALQDRRAVAAVLPFVCHPSAAVRRLAIETLGELGDAEAVEELLNQIDDSDPGCQQAAMDAVVAIVHRLPASAGEVLGRVKQLLQSSSVPKKLSALAIFVAIQGEGYHDELLLASKDSDPRIRQRAVSLMGRFGEERFADQIVLSLADEAPAVRLAAIQAVVSLRPERGLDPLLFALEDADIWIRAAAAQALGEYREPACFDPLIRHLRQDLPPVRIAAIEALGKSRHPSVRPVLFECLQEEDVEIRRAAVLALSRVAGGDAFDALMKALDDHDWRIRAAAASALGARGDQEALPEIHRALDDPDPYVQQTAVMALDRLADRTSFPHLVRALEKESIVDEVSELMVRKKDLYRDLLERAWREADSRREPVIAAILQSAKGK